MTKYVALLRGIAPLNPNMRNDKLRAVLEKLGFKNVRTVISSGNVLFETNSNNKKALEESIEKAWPKELGFNSTTIIRSHQDLQDMVNKDLFKGKKDLPKSRFNITFLKKGGEIPSIIYTTNYGATPNVMLELEKKHGKEITTRTYKTVERIITAMGK
jgi:uncharacterized protein (DUF1697 family)